MVMGSCLGHCRLSKETFGIYKFYSNPSRNIDIQINSLANSESQEYIVSESYPSKNDDFDYYLKNDHKQISYNLRGLKSLFSNVKNNYLENTSLKLELLDDKWSVSEGEDNSKRIESSAMPLSAKIKEPQSQSTRSINSLDLEWEHLPEMVVFSNTVEKEELKSATSNEGWSRISSADSLEWDSAEIEIKEEIDLETEQLLQEIEMLSSKTLQETQEWSS